MCMEQTPWQKAVEFHGHSCPGLAIGYLAAFESLKRLATDPAEDEELVAIVETDGCGVDAIQVLTGCTFGKGNLIFNDYGKNVFTFGVRGRDEGFRFSIKFGVMDNYAPEEWKELREKVFSQKATDEEKEKLKACHADFTHKLLHASAEDIFDIEKIKVDLPKKARIFNSVQCAFCGEGIMEPRARVKDGKFTCLECFESYRGCNCK